MAITPFGGGSRDAAEEYARELAELCTRIDMRGLAQAEDIRRRNQLIYKAIEAGLPGHEAADAAGVSHGHADRCHRTGGRPAHWHDADEAELAPPPDREERVLAERASRRLARAARRFSGAPRGG